MAAHPSVLPGKFHGQRVWWATAHAVTKSRTSLETGQQRQKAGQRPGDLSLSTSCRGSTLNSKQFFRKFLPTALREVAVTMLSRHVNFEWRF